VNERLVAMPKHSKPNIVLVVDNPVRDMPGLVLLAMELAKQGARAFLVPMKLQIPEIYLCSPDYVLLPYARVNNEALIEDLVSRGVRVGVLETEGAVFEEDFFIHVKASTNKSIRNIVSHQFVWGSQAYRLSLEHNWYNQDQLFLTGSPRFDFYTSVFRSALWALEPHIDDYSKPIVLIVTGYTMANPRFHAAETELENQIKRYNYDRDFANKILYIHSTNLVKMIEITNELAKKFPQVTFILRPHPFENEKVYIEKLDLDEQSNLHVIRLGTIDQWISRASLLIHRGSTTSLEAAICNVPSLTPSWLPILSVDSRDRLSIEIPNMELLCSTIQRFVQENYKPTAEYTQLKEEILHQTYGALDGNNHKRVTKVIIESVDKYENSQAFYIPSVDRRLAEWFLPTQTIRNVIRRILIELLHLPINTTLDKVKAFYQPVPWDSSEKRFTVDDVQKVIDAVTNHVEDFVNVRYRLQQGIFPQYRYLHGRTIVLETVD
jgi:surface carbohydrate biosynthesis protein